MADEGDESRRRSMDLNLYLGLPLSPRRRSRDLGSDLSLGSIPSPATAEEAPESTVDMPGLQEPSDAHTPYSPSHASFAAEAMVVVDDPSPDATQSSYLQSSSLPLESQPIRYDPIVFNLIPYSPSYVGAPPLALESDEQRVTDEDTQVPPYTPAPPPGLADEPIDGVGDPHLPYRSPYVPAVTTPQVHDESAIGRFEQSPVHGGDLFSRDGGSSSRQDLLQMPEFRFQSLIESNRRVRARRFRSSIPYRDESLAFGTSSFAAPVAAELTTEPYLRDMASERSLETSGKNKVSDEGIGGDGLEEEKEEKSGSTVNFECNICLDVAKEPVVTSCGHLFCWPCLYQWLHLHSDHKECPVCKGLVDKSNITPIYGRGSSEANTEDRRGEHGDSGLKIPPRPHGHRFESPRQRMQRPFRRFGEGVADPLRRILSEEMQSRVRGILDPALSVITRRLEEGNSSPQRHNLDEEMQSGIRLERQLDPTMQHLILDNAQHSMMPRLRACRLLRMADTLEGFNILQSGISRHAAPTPQAANSSQFLQDGTNSLHHYPIDISTTGRLAAIHADLSRLVSRLAGNGNRSSASASVGNPQNPEPPAVNNPQNPEMVIAQAPGRATQSADQVSASSTMAVIQDDAGATDTSAEPNRAGSSRSSRRRARNNAPGSLDIDGVLRVSKRRRLN